MGGYVKHQITIPHAKNPEHATCWILAHAQSIQEAFCPSRTRDLACHVCIQEAFCPNRTMERRFTCECHWERAPPQAPLESGCPHDCPTEPLTHPRMRTLVPPPPAPKGCISSQQRHSNRLFVIVDILHPLSIRSTLAVNKQGTSSLVWTGSCGFRNSGSTIGDSRVAIVHSKKWWSLNASLILSGSWHSLLTIALET